MCSYIVPIKAEHLGQAAHWKRQALYVTIETINRMALVF